MVSAPPCCPKFFLNSEPNQTPVFQIFQHGPIRDIEDALYMLFSSVYKLNLRSDLHAVAEIKTQGSIKCHKSCTHAQHAFPGCIKINKQRPRLHRFAA